MCKKFLLSLVSAICTAHAMGNWVDPSEQRYGFDDYPRALHLHILSETIDSPIFRLALEHTTYPSRQQRALAYTELGTFIPPTFFTVAPFLGIAHSTSPTTFLKEREQGAILSAYAFLNSYWYCHLLGSLSSKHTTLQQEKHMPFAYSFQKTKTGLSDLLVRIGFDNHLFYFNNSTAGVFGTVARNNSPEWSSSKESILFDIPHFFAGIQNKTFIPLGTYGQSSLYFASNIRWLHFFKHTTPLSIQEDNHDTFTIKPYLEPGSFIDALFILDYLYEGNSQHQVSVGYTLTLNVSHKPLPQLIHREPFTIVLHEDAIGKEHSLSFSYRCDFLVKEWPASWSINYVLAFARPQGTSNSRSRGHLVWATFSLLF
jgi:hypothetical protein